MNDASEETALASMRKRLSTIFGCRERAHDPSDEEEIIATFLQDRRTLKTRNYDPHLNLSLFYAR
jgi:hypothetical protein